MNEFVNYIIHAPETLTALQKIGIAYIVLIILSYVFHKKLRLIVFIVYATTVFLYSLDWTIRKTDVINMKKSTPITTEKEPKKIEPKILQKEEVKNVSKNPNIKIEIN